MKTKSPKRLKDYSLITKSILIQSNYCLCLRLKNKLGCLTLQLRYKNKLELIIQEEITLLKLEKKTYKSWLNIIIKIATSKDYIKIKINKIQIFIHPCFRILIMTTLINSMKIINRTSSILLRYLKMISFNS